MPIVKCSQGHYYDDVKYGACPHCTAGSVSDSQDPVTVAAYGVAANINERLNHLVEDEKTVGFFQSTLHADPVVGWLVCIDGAEKGRDYRLHTGRNFLGRSLKMDITIVDDKQISRENHCSIVYDPLGNEFYLLPGEGTVTYLANSMVSGQARLDDGAILRLGDSTFLFVSFTQKGFTW